MKQDILGLVQRAIDALAVDGRLPAGVQAEYQIERTRDERHGDLACNAAMVLARPARRPPREIAGLIREALPDNDLVEKVEVAGPGFLNFFLRKDARQAVIARILEQGARFGTSSTGRGRKAQVEYVSANPTGPLHVGHGRGAAVGDCLVRLLRATGWEVTSEFYYNDAGAQINNLALSVQARCQGTEPEDADWPEDGYRGEYIRDIAAAYLAGERVAAEDRSITAAGNPKDLEAIREFAVAYLRHEQDLDLRAFDVHFDVYFLESSLYETAEVENTARSLQDNGHTYEKDGALWLRTTEFGDDKDRVMRKSDGSYTYFLPDVAYHLNKWRRGFELVVNEQGADHHSTITRVRAGLQALDQDIPQGWPEYVLHQMVTVTRGGKEVKLSKRAGGYVTLRDLIDEAGRDATRFFLAARAPSSQLTFDIDLARSQSNDNPVYYVQYAHARICSVRRKLLDSGGTADALAGLAHLNLLAEEREIALMRALDRYPEMVSTAATAREPHQIAAYLRELAAEFHTWYNSSRVLVDDEPLRLARLSLSAAIQQVLANGLALLGVSAPESM